MPGDNSRASVSPPTDNLTVTDCEKDLLSTTRKDAVSPSSICVTLVANPTVTSTSSRTLGLFTVLSSGLAAGSPTLAVSSSVPAGLSLGSGNSVVCSSGLVSVLPSIGSSIASVFSSGSLVFNPPTGALLSGTSLPGSTTGFLTSATSSLGLATGSSILATFGTDADPPPPPPPPSANTGVDNATINPSTTAKAIPVRRNTNELFVSWLVIFISYPLFITT